MGIISATMGVLFMNADRIITGITIRTMAAANHREADPHCMEVGAARHLVILRTEVLDH